jgi:hypothetical protein
VGFKLGQYRRQFILNPQQIKNSRVIHTPRDILNAFKMTTKYELIRRASDVYDLISCRESSFNNRWYRPTLRVLWVVLFVVVCMLFTTSTLVHEPSTPSPFAFRSSAAKRPSICTGYNPLYADAIRTQETYLQCGGIHASDLATSKAQCDVHGQCIQVKLFDMNLYIGNVSSCYESRAQSLLMNLNIAVEQARMEGEILPNMDVYLSCADRPADGTPAVWYISKSTDNVNAANGRDNPFLMPDFNFYSWPEAFHEPWT